MQPERIKDCTKKRSGQQIPIACWRRPGAQIRMRCDIQQIIQTLQQHTIVWITDGSRINENTRAEISEPRPNINIALSKSPTDYYTETYAINACVRALEDYIKTCIYIFSDNFLIILFLRCILRETHCERNSYI